MHFTIQNLNNIKNEIKLKLNSSDIKNFPKIIAVSKTFSIDKINPLIESGHLDFGENKVQEAVDKWSQIKLNNKHFKLSVFLSTDSPIKNIVTETNNHKIINDELYIYSKDVYYIIIIIQLFIQIYETNNEEKNEFGIELYIDIITNLYKNWCCLKKQCLKMDHDLVKSLERININLDKGHLFITSKTKCKNNCCPYS